jgi:hypothetical protein
METRVENVVFGRSTIRITMTPKELSIITSALAMAYGNREPFKSPPPDTMLWEGNFGVVRQGEVDRVKSILCDLHDRLNAAWRNGH